MWHRERSLWVPERKLYYGFAIPGIVASQGGDGGAAPPAAPIVHAAPLSLDDLGSVSSRTLTFNGVAGDLLLAFIVQSGTTTLNVPTNWTDSGLGQFSHASVNFQMRWMWDSIAGSQTDQAFTVATAGDEWYCGGFRISGAHTTTPINAISFPNNTFTNSPVSPSVTTTVDNCLIIRFFSHITGTVTGNAYPSGMDTQHYLYQVNAGMEGPIRVSAASHAQAVAGATGTASWGTLSAARNVMCGTIAIAPAP